MWIFVFTQSPAPSSRWGASLLKVNTGLAYSFLGVLSLTTSAIGLTYSVYYSSIPARYITKFTRLSPGRYLLEDFLGSLLAILTFVGIIFISVIGLAYARWGIITLPHDQLGVIIDLVIAAILFYWLSYTLALVIIIIRRTRTFMLASYVPLIVGFLAYFQLWIGYGSAVYLIPVAPLIGILVYHSTGAYTPTGTYLGWLIGDKLYPSLNLRLAAISTLAWMAVFIIISPILLKKSRGVSIEELQ